MKKKLSLLMVALVAVAAFAVKATTQRAAGEVTDELTCESLFLDATSTSYVEVHDKVLTSTAAYSGQAASNKGSYIQLRATSPAGIVTTTSGGTLKSVTLTWNSATSSRQVDIYGSNTPYTDASDLYDTEKAGTLLGSIKDTDENQTLLVEGEYKYVGFRSNKSALYLDKVAITWDTTTAPEATETIVAGWKTGQTFGTLEIQQQEESQILTTGTVKYNKNNSANAVRVLKFTKSAVSADAFVAVAKLTAEGGFKAGDKITVQPLTSMKADEFAVTEETGKYANVLLYADATTLIANLTNSTPAARTVTDGNNEEGLPKTFEYTLEQDYDELYFGRGGNTNLFVMNLTVTRAIEEPVVIESMGIRGTFPGLSWDADLAMTKDAENSAKWTATLENVEVEATTYEYKAFANGETTGYQLPAEGNNNFAFGSEEYPAGKYNLTFTANTEEHTLTLAAVKVEEPEPEDTYVVAGAPASIFGTEWSGTAEANKMAKQSDGTYAKTYTVEAAVNDVQLKVVKNGAVWYGDANGNNVTFNLTGAGDFTVAYNPENNAVSVTGEIVKFPTDFDYEAVYAVGNGTDGWLNGEIWDPAAAANKMEKVADDVWEIKFTNVPQGTDRQVKFAIDGSWTRNFGGAFVAFGEETDAVYNGDNITFDTTAETQDITIRLDLTNFNFQEESGAKFTISTTATPEPAEITKVEIRGGKAGDWDSFSKNFELTLNEGVYSGTIDLTELEGEFEFKLVVNEGNWIGTNMLTLVDEAGLVVGSENDGQNFTLKNDVYQTYDVTATWVEGPDAAAGWTVTIVGKDERPVPATDIEISPAEGDIAAALATAKEGVAKVGNITINLTAGVTYTVSAPLVAYKNFEIQANGATIDASALEGNLIELNSIEAPTEWTAIDYVSIHNATVKGLKKALFYSGCKNYDIKWLTIDNSVIELAADATTIDFTKGSVARNFNVENSTIYAPTATTKQFYSSQAGQKATEAAADAVQSFIFKNSTLYNLVPDRNFFTHRQNSQKWLTFIAKNNIFVNCGKSGQVIKGMNGGSPSANPSFDIDGNIFNFNGADTSAAEETGDADEPVKNSVAGVVTFTDAAAGDFSGEFQLAVGAAVPESVGDPRWTLNFVENAVYTLVGSFQKWNGDEADEEVAVTGLFATKWDAENAENPNTLVKDEESGKYTLSFENIELPSKGNILYKVVKNHSWDVSYGTDTNGDCCYWINEAGIYKMTFTFDPNATGTDWFVSCTAEKTGDPTGINAVKAEQLKGAVIYNLNGQRVENAQKGLFIVNGRKVVIK